jgi:3'-phosphoadenosine 5'-phosphosulfate sulfotransferase (PAPS reductase)/FAD synthetase
MNTGENEFKISIGELRQRQSLPLEAKVVMAERRIRDWYEHWDGQIYVSFSGGKDSTVLLDLVRRIYTDVPAVFIDTGLEYPEIRDFVKTIDNVTTIRPRLTFKEVLERWGYPVVSKTVARRITQFQNPTEKNKAGRETAITGIAASGKPASRRHSVLPKKWRYLIDAPFKITEYCCDIMKKQPVHQYGRQTGRKCMTGEMASEGGRREYHYLKRGCNGFEMKYPKSTPLAIWNDDDIWEYIRTRGIPYASIYDTGVTRTGCMFCMFGLHMEKRPNRFETMKYTHPAQWEYCMFKLGLAEVLDFMGLPWGGQMEVDDYIGKQQEIK